MKSKVRTLVIGLMVLSLVWGVDSVIVAQTKYHEAPMLHELVLQGKLPPVDQRLPKNPKVVQPYEEIGRYGGTLYRVYTGVADLWNFRKFAGATYIKPVPGGLEPNVFDWWRYEDDGKTLVLHIREGIKWSDGVPVTVDDFIYSWELRTNPQVPEAFELRYMRDPAGKLGKLEKVDDYTIKIHYSVPYYLIPLLDLCSERGALEPKHYLIQFDPRYNPDVKDWSLLNEKLPTEDNFTPALVGYPMLSAWVITEYTPGVRIVAERNPYYWKVDPAGNQLPYIDRVVWQYVSSLDVIPLMVAAGKIDMQSRHLRFSDYVFYKQNEQKGNYTTRVLTSTSLGPAVRLNYDCSDPVLRDLIRNTDFRIALSYATNREEISKVVFKGVAEPWAYCQLPESRYYPGDKYAKIHTQYDPDKANAILDQLGLKDTDGDGIRNRPDGKNLSIVLSYSPTGAGGAYKAVVELLVSQWKKVGIQLIPDPMERALLFPRLAENKAEAYMWKVDGAVDLVDGSYFWLPVAPAEPQEMYKSAARWYITNGREGEEPIPWIKEALSLLRQLLQTGDPAKQAELGKKIAAMDAEYCYGISTTTLIRVGVVSNRLGNVPDRWVDGGAFRNEGVTRPWQFYIKEEG